MLWDVEFESYAFYEAVEAETREEAIERAFEWFLERSPDTIRCAPTEDEEISE